ncbi:hypothetical protein FXO38_32546 [Capsicum annuum]|uniref:Aminoacyl-tRNA synthetase class II (G/ P/ S/T) domain-containing protein n=1 Tax=Capsicum annuum TaxID=4072 RepID=A0A2G2Z166_CAPAN|nr:hypothetical protein FXO37_36017 [Capsicum annuum]KAF3620115.1 hypothetical protein FXO38_32546 [Capsicum annuum]PHT75615.1 hypothetical protein T459_19137 [Capsicum annuum]
MGKFIVARRVYKNCHVIASQKFTPIDLVELEMTDFDINLSMDWLHSSDTLGLGHVWIAEKESPRDRLAVRWSFHYDELGEDTSQIINDKVENKKLKDKKEVEVKKIEVNLDSKMETIGNLVHDSEKEYTSLQTLFFMRKDIMAKYAQLAQFSEELYKVTGEEDDKYLIATTLKGAGVHLNQVLINFSLYFLENRGYTLFQTPFFMRKDIMAKFAQLAQFSEELYKEAGSHGRNTLGIFRVHQFEKVEQFCLTNPNNNDYWDIHEEMIKNSEEFFQQIGLISPPFSGILPVCLKYEP